MSQPTSGTLEGLLRDTSRSFYLTLRALPASVRRQLGLAYLLARASDTIADTDAIPAVQRLEVLEAFRQKACCQAQQSLALDQLVGHQSSPAEQKLLQNLDPAIAALDELTPPDQERIRATLEVIIGGQALDLKRFAAGSDHHIIALEQEQELDDYTYRVAGCVGELWTRLCRAHVFPQAELNDALLLQNGVRFGKGLQLVNIMRDLPADLRMGRCYIPRPSLAAFGLAPEDLLNPANMSRFQPLYWRYLARAQEHLDAGWAYTNHLPFGNVRVRLACAWPILLGLQTLVKLRESNVLNARERVKVSRQDVRKIMLSTILSYPFRARWRALTKRWNRNPLPPEPTLGN